jgi:hypothetical protein
MSWTKLQVVQKAFEEFGLAQYVFDLPAEQLKSAAERLDTMMANWEAIGIHVGYNMADSPENCRLDEDVGVPPYAIDAMYLNLAVGLAPTVGKSVSPETKIRAKQALNNVIAVNVEFMERDLPATMPLGAGVKSWRSYGGAFVRKRSPGLAVSTEHQLVLE